MGPRAVGGAEQILTWLEAALPGHGWDSLVAARADSEPAGELFGTPVPPGPLTPAVQAEVTGSHQAAIDRALAYRQVDLVHMHGIDFHRYRLPRDLPVLVTLHLPPSWYPGTIWNLPANYRLQCVSESQRATCPDPIRERLHVVENGVPLPSWTHPARRDSFALLLSRICPEKNLHAGLDAARLAGVPVLLAGEAFPYPDHLRYLREEIEGRLHRGARLLGPVTGRRKERLLRNARCLLLPTLAPETSSVVAMEALAAGTPVIAYPSGAIPGILEHGRTGFLVDSVEAMAAAIGRLDEIHPDACRRAARERFTLTRMVDGYLALYARIAGRAGRNGTENGGDAKHHAKNGAEPKLEQALSPAPRAVAERGRTL